MWMHNLVTKLLIIKDRIVDRIDDHVFCLRTLIVLLLRGHDIEDALERTEQEWNRFNDERRQVRIQHAHRQCMDMAAEIEDVWIPRDTELARSGSDLEVANLLRECQRVRSMDQEPLDREVREALDRWMLAIQVAVENRG